MFILRFHTLDHLILTHSTSDLPAAVSASEELRSRMHGWPPINSGEEKHKRGLAGVMEDELGFVD